MDVTMLHEGLTAQGAVVRLLGPHVGRLQDADGAAFDADASLENEPGVLFDALAVVGGAAAAAVLAADVRALEHLRDGYRHGKPLLFVGEGRQVWDATGVTPLDNDPLLLFAGADADDTVERFAAAIARHRYPEREPAML